MDDMISRSAALAMMDKYICAARDGETHYAMCVVAEELKELPAANAGMTANEYQKLAMRTCTVTKDEEEILFHAVFGLNSEAGEVAGILQKHYQGHEVKREHLLRELGDCCWMIAEACTALDVTLEEVMQMNIDKLKARYPEGFDPEKSLHRKEGDV